MVVYAPPSKSIWQRLQQGPIFIVKVCTCRILVGSNLQYLPLIVYVCRRPSPEKVCGQIRYNALIVYEADGDRDLNSREMGPNHHAGVVYASQDCGGGVWNVEGDQTVVIRVWE